MKKEIKSIVWSAIVVLIFFFATIGITRLLWNTRDSDKFEGRVKFLMLSMFIFSLVYIIGIYRIVGIENVDIFYLGFFILLMIYLVVGNVVYLFMKN